MSFSRFIHLRPLLRLDELNHQIIFYKYIDIDFLFKLFCLKVSFMKMHIKKVLKGVKYENLLILFYNESQLNEF
ncbi:MAG: hypothetical protein BAJALOKI2v1_870006 [Promethearchaeota archaeon]|nr:MAG: hypothetical protein BAJALOKI2v1_870006 [Candidatus Lokiarchaeota archaeon]